ncbi:MAG: sugar ABC transporter permease [Trueperaceae bacterium]|nr:sugar ABC transporter permease [Trueperaceae bacterium]
MRLSRRRGRFDLFPFLMIGGAIVTLGAFMVYPLVSLVLMSMRDYGTSTMNYRFVGLDWFAQLPRDPRFVNGLVRTIVYSGSAVAGAMLMGSIMAFMLNRSFAGAAIVRTLFILPMVSMPVASALLWGTMFNPQQGVLNYFARVVGLEPSLWLASPATALMSLVIVEVWMSSPLVMLIVLAGLRSIPQEPLESARIDGANSLQTLAFVIVPMLRAALVAAALITLIDTLKQFPIIWVLTQGGPVRSTETLYVYGYALGFQFFDLGYGAAVLVVLLLLVVLVSVFVMRLRQRSWL